MENVRRVSKKYYLREIVACFLVSCLFFNAPVALADVVWDSTVTGSITVDPRAPGPVEGYDFTQDMFASDGAIGNFTSFDIPDDLFVRCDQPVGGNALFKVLAGGDGTQILGRFDAIGNVYLYDGAGIFVGAGGSVNANSFIASTLGIDNGDWQDFVGGITDKLKFGPLGVEDLRSAVENQGTITAPAGVYLVGAQVLNSGTINSDLVVMAAGEKVYLKHADSKVYIETPADLYTPDPTFNKVDNSGTIAAGAQVLLAAGDIFSTALNVASLAATANRDITLTEAVQTEGDMELVADFDGSGGASGGTMWAQSTLTSTAGSIDISASDDTIDLDDDVTADVDLTLNNDTTAAPGITLKAGQNVDIAAGKILTAEGSLTIEATAGEIMAETSIIDMDADNEDLTLRQYASMDLEEDFVVDNREHTDLFADSTGGSVTSDAAGEWLSVGGHAAENITLSDISEVITTQTLTTDNGDITIDSQLGKVEAYGAITAGQDVKITATDETPDSILLYNGGRNISARRDIWLNNNTYADGSTVLTAGQDVRLGYNENLDQYEPKTLTTAGNLTVIANRHITFGGDVTAQGDMLVVGDADNDPTGDVTTQALTTTSSNITVTGQNIETYGPVDSDGWITMLADDDITLHDYAEAEGSLWLHAGIDGDVLAESYLESIGADIWIMGGNIEVLGPVTSGTHMRMYAADNITLHDAATAGSFMTLVGDNNPDGSDGVSGGDVLAESYLEATSGEMSIRGDNIEVLGTVTSGTNMEMVAADHITLHDAATAGEDMTLFGNNDGGVIGDVVAKGNLTAGGNMNIFSSDNTTYLGGDLVYAVGSIILHNNTKLNGLGDQRVDAETGALDIMKNIDKIEPGSMTLAGHVDIGVGGNVRGSGMTSSDSIIFEDHVTANGTGDAANQRFDADAGALAANASIWKVNTGDLTLGGDAGIDLDGTVDVWDGSLFIEDNFTAGGDLVAKTDVIIRKTVSQSGTWVNGEFDGVGNQKVEATDGRLLVNTAEWPTDTEPYLTKSTDGDLLMKAGHDQSVHAHVTVTNGKLDMEAGAILSVYGNLSSTDDMTLTSNTDGFSGNYLNLHGNAESSGVSGSVEMTANGSMINLWSESWGQDVAAGEDIVLNDDTAVRYDGALLDAGRDVILANNEDITADGALTVQAGRDILLGVNPTSPWITSAGDVTAGGDLVLTAGDNIHAYGKLLTETDSGGNITATAVDDIHLYNTPTSADADGTLTLTADSDDGAGGYGGNLTVDGALYGNMELSGVDVTVDGDVVSDGILDVDADYDIKLKANVSSVGVMTMDAGSDIELNRNSGNTSSDSTIALNAGDDITIGKPFGGNGNVTANGNMDIIAGVDYGDDVKVFGKLTTTDGGNINVQAGGNIKLYGSFDGPDYESAEADGDMTLDAGYDVDVLGDLISNNGSIDIYSSDWTTYLGGDVYAAYDVTLHNNTKLDGCGDQTLAAAQAGYGTLTADGFVWKVTPGDLYLYGNTEPGTDAISLNNNRDSECEMLACLPAASTCLGNLELFARNGDIQISGDLTTFGMCCYGGEPGPRLTQNGGYDGYGYGWYERPTGGVSVIAENGKIYTEGASPDNDTLNIGIVGNSDHLAYDEMHDRDGLGVDLPWLDEGEEGKAAIVVLSRDDLVFGPDTQLIAKGTYYDDGSVDDRPGVDFLEAPATIGGVDRDEGDAMDVAIYIGSMGTEEGQGNVHLDGRAIDVEEGGAMVVDAYDTVTFGDFETFNFDTFDFESFEGCVDFGCFMIKLLLRFGEDILADFTCDDLETAAIEFFGSTDDAYAFLEALMSDPEANKGTLGDFLDFFFGEGYFFNIDRMEVSSRITEWLFQAVSNGRLPFAGNAAAIAAFEEFIGGEYVLRGAGLGNPAITDGRAWVLEDPILPPPLYTEAGERAEEQEFGEGGCPALMNWLAGELGVEEDEIEVFVANTFAYSTDIQPCEMCARLKDAATILADAEGTGVAGLVQVVNEFVATPAPPSEEQMASIATAFADHTDDGTYYAAAGQWIDALVEYVGILTFEMGYSAEESTGYANKYIEPVTDTGNASLIAYVEARLAALGG